MSTADLLRSYGYAEDEIRRIVNSGLPGYMIRVCLRAGTLKPPRVLVAAAGEPEGDAQNRAETDSKG